jgi:hypothetical protein
MIRYYLKTEINKVTGTWDVYYFYDGKEEMISCKSEKEAKKLYDEIYAEKKGYPII